MRHLPADTQQDHLPLKMAALERDHRRLSHRNRRADHTPDHGHTKILRQSPMTIDARECYIEKDCPVENRGKSTAPSRQNGQNLSQDSTLRCDCFGAAYRLRSPQVTVLAKFNTGQDIPRSLTDELEKHRPARTPTCPTAFIHCQKGGLCCYETRRGRLCYRDGQSNLFAIRRPGR